MISGSKSAVVTVANQPLCCELPAIASSQHNGRLATVTTADFDPEITERLTRRGAVIQSIDNMTLEEIFVSEVMSSREGEAA